jgi:nucleoside-diphosphate-sugar epimerase
LVPALANLKHDLVLVDNRTGPIRVEWPSWPALAADFQSAEGLRALSDCDVILHLAAVSGVMACAQNPMETSRTNVEGTRRLLEQCRDHRIPVAFASSLAVVGSPERLPVSEDTPPRPTHEYARQKAEGERLTRALAQEAGVTSAVLRMSNVYGSYTAGPKSIAKGNVLTLFLSQARSGRLTVNAPGTQRRDFVHIEDVLAHWTAVVRWLCAPGAPCTGPTFNVASGESYSVLEIAALVRDLEARLRPSQGPVAVAVVPNPREGIELVDPEFTVTRAGTERVLGVRCSHRVTEFLESSLRA